MKRNAVTLAMGVSRAVACAATMAGCTGTGVFHHNHNYLRAMTTLLENGLPVSDLMEAVKGPLLIRRG